MVRGIFRTPKPTKRLKDQIDQADKLHGTRETVFYLAVRAAILSPIAKMLADCCLTKEESGHWPG